MKKSREYLLIALALAALFILSLIGGKGPGTTPCCPFSAQPGRQSQ